VTSCVCCRLSSADRGSQAGAEGGQEKVQSLETNLQEADAGTEVLKEVLKGTVDSEEAIAAKLAYERKARKDLEVSLEVALKAIQDDQVIITGKEV
jgi:hypothetical protein